MANDMMEQTTDIVNEAIDAVSDVANTSHNVGDFVKGGLIGGTVVAAGFAAYKFLFKPLWTKVQTKRRLAKAKRANESNDDVPRDINEEFPIK